VKHVEKLQSTVDNLLKVSTLQYRYLLLRYCFCPKVTHLLRNTRPDLSIEIVNIFDNFKRRIFCETMGKDISDLSWLQCQLHINDGGYGLGNLEWIRHSAFAASFISNYWATVGTRWDLTDSLASLGTVDNKHLLAFQHSFEFFRGLDPDRFPDIDSFVNVVNTKASTESIQSALTSVVYKGVLKQFVGQLSGPHLAWHTSLTSPDAQRSSIPTDEGCVCE
jgi:hypothetical protein